MALQSTTALLSIALQQTSSTVTFSGITSAYRDLIIVTNTDNTERADYYLRFNGDTGSNYNRVTAQGTGSVASFNLSTNAAFMRLNGNADFAVDFSHNSTIYIMDYAVTDKHKSVLSRTNSTWGVDMTAGRWASTAPITSVTIYPSTGSFDIGSTFSLYGRIA
jgi:hypothetical protein